MKLEKLLSNDLNWNQSPKIFIFIPPKNKFHKYSIYIIKMNITQTFRRKNKYHKPIIVFKQLYRDYFKHNPRQKFIETNLSERNQDHLKSVFFGGRYLNKSLIKNEDQSLIKINKTRSAEQFTVYLMMHGEAGSSIGSFTQKTSQNDLTKRSLSTKKSNTYVIRSLQKNRFERLEKQKQSYFQNNYTKSHPFFERNANLFKEKVFDSKQLQTSKILPQIFKQTSTQLRKPIQKRIQLEQLKKKYVDRKTVAIENSSKARYNFLVKKNIRKQSQVEPQINAQVQKSSFRTTKENIFPETETEF